MRGLKQNEKDQADLKGNDVMEVRNGETIHFVKWSMRNAMLDFGLRYLTRERLQDSCALICKYCLSADWVVDNNQR